MDLKKEECELPWSMVEKAIHKEIDWLMSVVDVDLRGHRIKENAGIFNEDYIFYRSIAILIVNGKVKATEINSNKLWYLDHKDIQVSETKHRHGKDWHMNTMNFIHKYFEKQAYEVTTEPSLYKGRADLGIFKNGEKDLYVEVGTTSIDKLCINLHLMKDCAFLLTPMDNQAIKLEIL